MTVKDACEATNISISTFNRWRNTDIEFDRLIGEATKKGWENAEAFAKYRYRGYKRKVVQKLPPLPEKPLAKPPSGLKEHFSKPIEQTQNRQTYAGLPVLFTYPEKYPSDFYINGNNGMVERFTKEGILQTMRIDKYERTYLGKDGDICFGMIF